MEFLNYKFLLSLLLFHQKTELVKHILNYLLVEQIMKLVVVQAQDPLLMLIQVVELGQHVRQQSSLRLV